MYVLVATVIPSGKLPKYGYISELNKEIKKMVSGLNDERVVLVDQASRFNWKKYTIHDKVHPNRLGSEYMASVWFDSLRSILPKLSSNIQKAEIIKYKTLANKDSLCLHVFKPNINSKRPAIVYFFGGGWNIGSPLQFYRECRHYSSLGMVAISVEYRIKYLHKSSPFESFQDAKDAIIWIRKHASYLGVDSSKIVVAGASAGGQLASALCTIGGKKSIEEGYKPNLQILLYPAIDNGPSGYGPPEVKDRYKEISPLHNIDEYTSPAFIIIGTKDNVTPLETIFLFKRKMNKNGIQCKTSFYKNAQHPIFSYRETLNHYYYSILEEMDNFLKENGYL